MNEREKFESMASLKNKPETEADNIATRLKNNVKKLRHTILTGPPGTGKSRTLNNLINQLKSEDSIGTVETVQFHPQYSYQDFIEGFTVKSGVFDYKKGIFLEFLDRCDDNKLNIFIIDEFNRADVSSVFGELLGLLDYEDGKTITLPNSRREISLGKNTLILGTMNSADKNIALMDFALRRRFSFLFTPPDYDGLTKWINSIGLELPEFQVNDYVNAIKVLNHRIIRHPLLGKNMTLGQSFFVPKTSNNSTIKSDDIFSIFSEMVVPQLETYVGHGNNNELAQILSPSIADKLKIGEPVTPQDVTELLNLLSRSKENF